MFALETHEITRTFGRVTAVDAVSFHVGEGEVYGVLGPNGAGKTTLIKMLSTLLPLTSGSAQVAGWDVVREPARVRASIGYVPQLISADPQVSGNDNLWVFARLYQIPRAERRQRIREALEFMGLTEVGDVLVRNYSGGMIRRLELALALLHRPKILFLDEPTVGLDPIARDTVWGQIERLRKEYRTAVVLTTHYMEEADRLCDRLAILHHGVIVAEGSPTELKSRAPDPSATLEDAFVHFVGGSIETGGSYRDTQRTRRTAIRLE